LNDLRRLVAVVAVDRLLEQVGHGVRLTDDLGGLLPEEPSGEGAGVLQGCGKAPADLAEAFSLRVLWKGPDNHEPGTGAPPLLPGCFPNRLRGSSM
jgi:hypothetical protein